MEQAERRRQKVKAGVKSAKPLFLVFMAVGAKVFFNMTDGAVQALEAGVKSMGEFVIYFVYGLAETARMAIAAVALFMAGSAGGFVHSGS